MARYEYGKRGVPGLGYLTTEDVPQGPFNEEAHPLTGQYSPGEMFTTPGGIFTTGNPIPHSAKAFGLGGYGAPDYTNDTARLSFPDVGTDEWWRMMEQSNMPRDAIYRALVLAGAPWSTVPPRPSQMRFGPQPPSPPMR